MISKAIHATYDGQSFHVTEAIDNPLNTDCIIYVEETQDQKPIDAIDYLFSIVGTANGPPEQSLKHDYYLYDISK